MDRNKLLAGYDDKRTLFGMFFAFNNQLQTVGDAFYEEITCKQFFLLICLSLFKETPPTINELSEVMGSSHQNVKQLAIKLEKSELIKIYPDEQDKRKLRIAPTEKMGLFGEKYQAKEMEFMDKLYTGLTDKEIADVLKTMMKIENNLISIREEM